MMKKIVIILFVTLLLIAIGALIVTHYGEDSGGRGSARSVLPSMIAECGGPDQVIAFSDIGEGNYGATSSWAMICRDGRVLARDD
jgi:hypothetical protein